MKNFVLLMAILVSWVFGNKSFAQSHPLGIPYKRIDVDAGRIKSSLNGFDVKIRKVEVSKKIPEFFLVIERIESGYRKESFITEKEFIELLKAVEVFYTNMSSDQKSTSNYLEHIFSTETGIDIGYLVTDSNKYAIGKEFQWFIRFDRDWISERFLIVGDLKETLLYVNEILQKFKSDE